MLWADMYTSSNIFNNNNGSSLPPLQGFQSSFNQDVYNSQNQASVGGSTGSSTEEEETQFAKSQRKSTLKRKSSPEEDENNEEKRKNFLERNRQAALKCRQRKKQWLNNLQERIEFLANDNEQLQMQATVMKDEVRNLQKLLIMHKDCPMNNGNNKIMATLSQYSVTTSPPNTLYSHVHRSDSILRKEEGKIFSTFK
ncbi:unnamed protein product [Mucor hiemalis]